jgi:hypothetical protein
MTDGQDYQQDEPWQGKKYNTDTHRQRIISSQPPLNTNWFQPGSAQQDPPQDPPSQPPYAPPGGPQDQKSWAARHKVLTGVVASCVLVLAVGIAAAASSSSSSSPSATAANNPTVTASRATANPTVKAAVATHPRTTAPAAPGQTPLASPSAQPETTAPTHKAAPSASATTTATATSSPTATPTPTPTASASTAPASCYPLNAKGKCFEPGQFCPKADHGLSGLAGDGEAIVCVDVNSWAWAIA